MKNKLGKRLIALCASILTLFAMTISASACTFSCYQPEEPECLRQE